MESAVESKAVQNHVSNSKKYTILAAKCVALASALLATAGVIMLFYGVYGHRTYNFYGAWYGNQTLIALHYQDCSEHPVVGPLPASGEPLPIVGGTLTDISTIDSFPQLPGIYSLYILAGWFILYGAIGIYIGTIAGLILSNEKALALVLDLAEEEVQRVGFGPRMKESEGKKGK